MTVCDVCESQRDCSVSIAYGRPDDEAMERIDVCTRCARAAGIWHGVKGDFPYDYARIRELLIGALRRALAARIPWQESEREAP